MEFCCSDMFAQTLLNQSKGQLIAFESHEELNDQVQLWQAKCPAFDIIFKGEYTLLKAFDRAFHLKHRKYKQTDAQLKQLQDCIFDRPENTNSVFNAM